MLDSCFFSISRLILFKLSDSRSSYATIFLAISWKIGVGTASPRHWRIFISFFLRNSFLSSSLRELSVSVSRRLHLNEFGMPMKAINSLILKTLGSSGWMVDWLASMSLRVCTHGATLSQKHLVYLSPFLFWFSIISPSTILWGRFSGFSLSKADCPSLVFIIQFNIRLSYGLNEW